MSLAFGAKLDKIGYVEFNDLNLWVSIFVFAIIFSLILQFIWTKLSIIKIINASSSNSKIFYAWVTLPKPKQWLILNVLIIRCWVPVFLAVYPGFFVYDAFDQYQQIVTRNFTTHHPLLHVLSLGGIIHVVYHLTGSHNLGIACFIFIQMMIMAGIFFYIFLCFIEGK